MTDELTRPDAEFLRRKDEEHVRCFIGCADLGARIVEVREMMAVARYIEQLQRDNAALTHDLDGYMQSASAEATRADAMERDAERLDWLLAHSHMRVQGRPGGRYVVWDCSNGLVDAGTGDTARSAIDAAMSQKETT
jgi:hypothetical protein